MGHEDLGILVQAYLDTSASPTMARTNACRPMTTGGVFHPASGFQKRELTDSEQLRMIITVRATGASETSQI